MNENRVCARVTEGQPMAEDQGDMGKTIVVDRGHLLSYYCDHMVWEPENGVCNNHHHKKYHGL